MSRTKSLSKDETDKLYSESEFYGLGEIAMYWFCLKRNEEFCLDTQSFQKNYLSKIRKYSPSILVSKMSKELIVRKKIDPGLMVFLNKDREILADSENQMTEEESREIHDINTAYRIFIGNWRIAPRYLDSNPPFRISPMPSIEKNESDYYIDNKVLPIVIKLDPRLSFKFNMGKAEKAIREAQKKLGIEKANNKLKGKSGKNHTSVEEIEVQLRMFEIKEAISTANFVISPGSVQAINKQSLTGKNRSWWPDGILAYHSKLKKQLTKSSYPAIAKDLKNAELYIERPQLILKYIYDEYEKKRNSRSKRSAGK